MERTDELMDKFFSATTTLDEERELKEYFLSGKVRPEHKPYISLFLAFDNEKATVCTGKILMPEVRKVARKSLWLTVGGVSAVAASFIIAVTLFYPKEDTNYAVIHGKRIEQKEFVKKYAEAKLEKVNRLLSRNLEPLKKLEKIETEQNALDKLVKAQQMVDNAKKLK